MAYTRVWSITRPPGTELAKNIDNEIRYVREDIAERMAALITDWTADPVVPKDTILGNVSGKKILIPHSAFIQDSPNSNESYNTEFETMGVSRAALILPVGVTIKLVEILIDYNTSSSITHSLVKNSFSTTTVKTTVYSLTNSGSGKTILTSGALSETVQDTALYAINVDCQGVDAGDSFRLYGARVTYDTPDCRKTI